MSFLFFFFFFTDDYVILVQGFLETFPPGVRGENHELTSGGCCLGENSSFQPNAVLITQSVNLPQELQTRKD